MQYKVIDNYLTEEEHKAIKDIVINPSFPWYYNPFVTASEYENLNTFYFVHLFYKDYCPQSNFFGSLMPLINKLDAKAILRIKGNMYPSKKNNDSDPDHVDETFEHKGAIYYINTNNGCTVLEDGTKIESVANRILFFEPHKLHHSTYCTDEKIRINININYL